MDKNIRKILEVLESNGFEAYLVGGYVRDRLLGIESFDVDICTNALPKDLNALFSVSENNYGCVNLKSDKYNIDITTYRRDKNYKNRRPEVIYIDSLAEDLKRRDFTINALVMDKNENVIDLIQGIDDINARIIRSIGDVDTKLKEDPLRILRAIRFATILDFEIDKELYKGIKKNKELVANLSKMRVKEELDKILLSKNFKKGLNLMQELGINDILNLSYQDINYVQDLVGMWAQIKVSDIPFTNVEKSNIIKIAEVVSAGVINYKMLFSYGLYICTVAGLILNISPEYVNKIYRKMPIKGLDDVAISGDEVMFLLNIEPGPQIGSIYDDLVDNILKGKLKNKNKDIKNYLLKRK